MILPVRRRAVPAGSWIGALVLAAVVLCLVGWSWNRWPDLVVDFWKEVYIAWQLAEGRVLYTDVAYFGGPLAPWLNGLWLRWFGVGLQTLVVANLCVVAVLLAVWYRLLLAVSDAPAATLACVTGALLSVASQYGPVGSYNFLCPYSHDLTYGLLVASLGLWCFAAYLQHRRWTAVAGMGVAVGLAWLTKPEIALAAGVALTAGLGVAVWTARPVPRQARRVGALYACSAAVPVVAAWLALGRQMPLLPALYHLFSAWSWAADRDIVLLPFYQWGLWGTHDLPGALLSVSRWSALYVVLAGSVAVVALHRARARHRLAVRVMVALAYLAVLWWVLSLWKRSGALADLFQPLPVLMGGLSGLACWHVVRQYRGGRVPAPSVSRLALLLFAGLLLAKMALNSRIYHYGFALAFPAVLLTVVAFAGWLADAVARRGGDGGRVRAAALACCVAVAMAHLGLTRFWFQRKTVLVGKGADAFWADERGRVVNEALETLRRVLPQATLAVMPEGVLLNYLSRRRNPTPYTNFVTPLVLSVGEARMVDALEAQPPDYIMLMDRATSEYGTPRFGRDYGRQLAAWVRARYRAVALAGAPPLQDLGFGLLLLEPVDRTP